MKYKYLIIFTAGDKHLTNEEPKQSDFDAYEDGIIEIINLETYTTYAGKGIWEPIAEF